MKFQVLDIIPHLRNPLTGSIVSTADRFDQVIGTAQRTEELGFDAFAVGERHAGESISSSPTAVLAAIAAATSTIRLQSGATVLSVLDPVRVAEDYATIDQLSRGRLELVIGKGDALPFSQQLEILERFAAEVIPVVRAAAPTTLWEDQDPWAGRPAGRPAPEFAGTTEGAVR